MSIGIGLAIPGAHVAVSSGVTRINPVKECGLGTDENLYLVDVIMVRRHFVTAVGTGGSCISHIVHLYRLSALFALYFKKTT